MIGRYACALLIAFASSSALAQPTPAPDTSALFREVEQLNRGMEAAFNRGDLRGAASFYADDAIVRTARGIVAQGRAALDQYFLDISDPKSWKLDVIQVGGTRDMAYQVGRSTLVHGNPERTSVVQFLVIWKRQTNGQLRIMLDYYHSAEPMRRPAG